MSPKVMETCTSASVCKDVEKSMHCLNARLHTRFGLSYTKMALEYFRYFDSDIA